MGSRATKLLAESVLLLFSLLAAGCSTPSSSTPSGPSNAPTDAARAKLFEAFSEVTAAVVTLDGTLVNTSSNEKLVADLKLHADLSAVSSASGTVTGTVAGKRIDTRAVLVSTSGAPSSIYESDDGGNSWSKTAGASASLQYLETPLEYVSSASRVTDEGRVDVGGTSAEWYHASLAGQSLLSAVSASTTPPTSLIFQSATADVYVDRNGRIIKLTGLVEASGRGTAFSQKLSCTFGGYGQKVTITPPPGAG